VRGAAIMGKRSARGHRVEARAFAFADVGYEICGLVLIVVGLLAVLALVTYSAQDPAFRIAPVDNAAGVVGASMASVLVSAMGLAAVVPVLGILALGVHFLMGRGMPSLASRFWVGVALLLVSSATLPALLQSLAPARFGWAAGGSLGVFLADTQRSLLSGPGALVLNTLLLLVGLLGILGVAPGRALAALARGVLAASHLTTRVSILLGRSLRGVFSHVVSGVVGVARFFVVWREQRIRRARVAALRDSSEDAPQEVGEVATEEGQGIGSRLRARRRGAPDIVDHREQSRPAEPVQESFPFQEATTTGPYQPPDTAIFQEPPPGARGWDRDSLIMNSRILEKKLQDFGVKGRVVTVHPGPVITMYEFEPAPGVKVNRITSLSDDLALALRALSIRIIAPIPGKPVVGIEVPNSERDIVYIRDLIESKSFRASGSKLTIPLGKDIFGNPVEADLAAMPHLLVAGATGTGKSVFLNSLLCSILVRATPDDVKLLLVDPKLLELSIYEGIPHLIADVVTNPKRAAAALKGVVMKMEERYHMMAALGVRNIAQFNRRVDEEIAAGNKTFRMRARPDGEAGDEIEYRRLPYILVVIDELADLMVVSARDVEESLQRLAQMARAAGIHLVLATQRPSVDVLTGVIKANFAARISFQVSSRVDSRTILDQSGAEHLLGQGDMLFLPPGTSKLQRLHGSFVSEREVAKLAAFLRAQGVPKFDEDLVRLEEESAATEFHSEDTDEHYDRALEIVAESRNASISYLQRRLKVGYNRAARMIEQMEQEGVVGPQEGTRPREVYIRPIGADDA
jgi:S-DNA-T family DNA segregation ATPase FtsK/SpoIIIE